MSTYYLIENDGYLTCNYSYMHTFIHTYIHTYIHRYVVRRIGESQSRRYFTTAEMFSAEKAVDIGLLHEVVTSAGDLESKITDLQKCFLQNSPNAVRRAKELVSFVSGNTISESLMEATAHRLADIRASEEGKEGTSAFLERRKPNWIP